MSSLFDYVPTIKYNSITSVNILEEATVISQYTNDYRTFYNYLLKDGERADIVAYNEYGDPTLDWIIFMVNGVTDPYKDWLLDYNHFILYLENKYNRTSYSLTSTTDPTAIKYYYYQGLASDDSATIASYNYTMSYNTYVSLGSPAGWVAKTIYDYEFDINESKRNIKLLKPQYISDFKQQVKNIFNG